MPRHYIFTSEKERDRLAKPNSISSGTRKKVLIVTYYWPPAGGAGVQRFLKFVKYFPDYGIDPVVLTCSNPTYPIQDATLAEDIPAGVPVHAARTIEPFGIYSRLTGTSPEKAADPTNVLGTKTLGLPQRLARWLRANIFIPDARVGWVPFARTRARKLLTEYRIDTVITTGPPHSTHFTGRWLKRKTGVRWIADFRDPWTDIHYNRALPRTVLTQKLDARMEAKVIRAADEITVTAPGTARYLNQKVNRIYHTIYNGFDPDDFDKTSVSDHSNTNITRSDFTEKSSSPQSVNRKKQPEDGEHQSATSDTFLIRHTGSVTETSIPFNLLRALSRLQDLPFRMEFIGFVHPHLRKYVTFCNLEKKIKLLPYVSHWEATKLMQQSDLNVVVVHRSEDSRILIPGKIFDYLKAGRPVMVIGPPDGDAAEIVRKCRIGMAFGYEDETGPEEWLRSLYNDINPSLMGNNTGSLRLPQFDWFSPDEQEIAQYSRPELTARFAGIIYVDHTVENDLSPKRLWTKD